MSIHCVLKIDRNNRDFAKIIVASTLEALVQKCIAEHIQTLKRYGSEDHMETDVETIMDNITTGVYDIEGEYTYIHYRVETDIDTIDPEPEEL